MFADFARARKRKESLSALHVRRHFTRFLQDAVKRRGKRIDRSYRLAHPPAFERTLHLREHRSEEHTSELQSLRHLVCRLLLEKKKIEKQYTEQTHSYITLT